MHSKENACSQTVSHRAEQTARQNIASAKVHRQPSDKAIEAKNNHREQGRVKERMQKTASAQQLHKKKVVGR